MHLWDEAKLSLEQSQNTTRPGQNKCWARSGGVIGVKVWVQIRVEYGGGSSSEFLLCAKPLDAPLGRSQIVFGAEPKHHPPWRKEERRGGKEGIGGKVWVQFRDEYGGGSSSEFVLCAKPLDAPLGRSQIVFGAEPKHHPAWPKQVLGAFWWGHWGQSLGPD